VTPGGAHGGQRQAIEFDDVNSEAAGDEIRVTYNIQLPFVTLNRHL